MRGWGARVWAVGIVALGLIGLAFGDFEGGQAAPKWLPDRALAAAVVNVFLVVAGAAAAWRRTRGVGAAALAVWWLVAVAALMGGRVILLHPREFGAYSGLAEVAAVGLAGLIVFAGEAAMSEARRAALVRGAQVGFGVCAILFGGAHFVYMNLTAPLVPRWLPGSGVSWGYATGAAQIAAGLAIISGVWGARAAKLLTVMYAAFQAMVHLPLLIGAPGKEFFWSENALNLALVGAAWVVAASLRRGSGP